MEITNKNANYCMDNLKKKNPNFCSRRNEKVFSSASFLERRKLAEKNAYREYSEKSVGAHVISATVVEKTMRNVLFGLENQFRVHNKVKKLGLHSKDQKRNLPSICVSGRRSTIAGRSPEAAYPGE